MATPMDRLPIAPIVHKMSRSTDVKDVDFTSEIEWFKRQNPRVQQEIFNQQIHKLPFFSCAVGYYPQLVKPLLEIMSTFPFDIRGKILKSQSSNFNNPLLVSLLKNQMGTEDIFAAVCADDILLMDQIEIMLCVNKDGMNVLMEAATKKHPVVIEFLTKISSFPEAFVRSILLQRTKLQGFNFLMLALHAFPLADRILVGILQKLMDFPKDIVQLLYEQKNCMGYNLMGHTLTLKKDDITDVVLESLAIMPFDNEVESNIYATRSEKGFNLLTIAAHGSADIFLKLFNRVLSLRNIDTIKTILLEPNILGDNFLVFIAKYQPLKIIESCLLQLERFFNENLLEFNQDFKTKFITRALEYDPSDIENLTKTKECKRIVKTWKKSTLGHFGLGGFFSRHPDRATRYLEMEDGDDMLMPLLPSSKSRGCCELLVKPHGT